MNATLTCLSSNSSGNGYSLDANGEQLIIECGVPFKECAEKLNYEIGSVVGVICSHRHSDHFKYAKQYRKHGLCVYSPSNLTPNRKYRFGEFSVIPLQVPHGDCVCFAYVIVLPDGQKCLFATDLTEFPYSIKGLHQIFLECNYSEEIRVNAVLNGADVHSSSQTHMELNTCIDTINRLKSPQLQQVILLHLSLSLSDSEAFKRAIRKQCRVNVEVASKNTEFILCKDDF